MLGGMTATASSSAHVFANAVETLGREARRLGLVVPGFRSPPRVHGALRTVRRHADGGSIVAVQVRGRPSDAIVRDVVDGILVANRLRGDGAVKCRDALLAVFGQSVPAVSTNDRSASSVLSKLSRSNANASSTT